jgi:hypothetical protein
MVAKEKKRKKEKKTMEAKMMVAKEKKKKRTEEKKKKEEGKKGGIVLKSREVWASEKKRNPPQCGVWFRLNGLGSSQNGQNSLIHNWCTGGCWFTLAQTKENTTTPMVLSMLTSRYQAGTHVSWFRMLGRFSSEY